MLCLGHPMSWPSVHDTKVAAAPACVSSWDALRCSGVLGGRLGLRRRATKNLNQIACRILAHTPPPSCGWSTN